MLALRIILGLALLGSLVFAGARIYRGLPEANSGPAEIVRGTPQDLTIVFRAGVSVAQTRVNLYPIDMAATERDYANRGRPGKSLEDFLAARLKGVPAVNVQIDGDGRGVARIGEGSWWMHAVTASNTGESVEWRVPLTIAQRPQTIELSSENAYERSKKF
jgi:hypothetical protein